jgi:hypothetical protein
LLRASAFGACLACYGPTLRAVDSPNQSIREYARENGNFESLIVWTDKRFNLADLAGQGGILDRGPPRKWFYRSGRPSCRRD